MKVIRNSLIKGAPHHIWKFSGLVGKCEICGLVANYSIDTESWTYVGAQFHINCRAKAMNDALE